MAKKLIDVANRTLADDYSGRPPLLVGMAESGRLLGVCRRTLENYISAKQLPCRKIGRRSLIPYAALVAFAKKNHSAASTTSDATTGVQVQ